MKMGELIDEVRWRREGWRNRGWDMTGGSSQGLQIMEFDGTRRWTMGSHKGGGNSGGRPLGGMCE